jgi:hypothetical protein
MAELVWTVTVLCVVLSVMAFVADRVPESWVDTASAWMFGEVAN